MDTDETREAAAGGRYVSNGQHCVACEGDELPDCRRAGIRFAAADRSTDTLPPTALPTPWIPPLIPLSHTSRKRKNIKILGTASSSNLVISFRGRSHIIHSPSPTCFPDCAGGLVHYCSTDMVDATQAA